ncbi:hypothetical protein, partial [Lacisediminimonas profundi]|uniref:hypothetical protein n=1 Tax=Lacisediminimonas profundi TaxID=2603856 RepID=UPI0019D603B9
YVFDVPPVYDAPKSDGMAEKEACLSERSEFARFSARPSDFGGDPEGASYPGRLSLVPFFGEQRKGHARRCGNRLGRKQRQFERSKNLSKLSDKPAGAETGQVVSNASSKRAKTLAN